MPPLVRDGKPNDLDHYEGRYGIEDTRQAIIEGRRAGLAVFGITIDRKAQDYFPYLLGRWRLCDCGSARPSHTGLTHALSAIGRLRRIKMYKHTGL